MEMEESGNTRKKWRASDIVYVPLTTASSPSSSSSLPAADITAASGRVSGGSGRRGAVHRKSYKVRSIFILADVVWQRSRWKLSF